MQAAIPVSMLSNEDGTRGWKWSSGAKALGVLGYLRKESKIEGAVGYKGIRPTLANAEQIELITPLLEAAKDGRMRKTRSTKCLTKSLA
jgi:hypothetical protein